MLAELERLEPRLLALEMGDSEKYQDLATEFRSFYPFLRDLTQFSLVGPWIKEKKRALNRAYLFMMVSFAGIIISTGALIYFFLRQIRRNIAASQALQEAHNSLELRVEQRTRELVDANATLQQEIAERKRIEEALRLATRDAEQASKSKSRFLVAASHDLRQPLQALSLLHRVLSETLTARKEVKILQDMGHSLTIMSDLLNKLLDISKLELGKITPDPENFRVGELLERVGNPAAAEAREKGLELRVIPCSAVIFSDRTLLERVMENLISNAIRYTHSGKIVFGCRRRGPNLRIEVWDSGAGIPEDQKQSIFEEYYQIGNTGRDRNFGLGLGLALVQRTTQLLGHRLEMESVPGSGSVFSVEVPLGAAVGAGDDYGTGVGAGDMAGKLVALIEDDYIVAKATQLLLEQWGLEVIIGADSAETLKELRGRDLRPSLIIADYRLVDGKTGVRETEQLWDALGRTPAIVITGDTGEDTLREIEAAGCELLHKPVDPYELRQRTHRMIADTVMT
jgi:signal transduction histidine kinase